LLVYSEYLVADVLLAVSPVSAVCGGSAKCL
jgi:hypothetical protein